MTIPVPPRVARIVLTRNLPGWLLRQLVKAYREITGRGAPVFAAALGNRLNSALPALLLHLEQFRCGDGSSGTALPAGDQNGAITE